jgi:hypothetical protein
MLAKFRGRLYIPFIKPILRLGLLFDTLTGVT